MRIAFIIEELGGGGSQRSVLNLAEGLTDRGHQVDIVLLRALIHYPVPESVRLLAVDRRPDRLTEEKSQPVLARLIQLPAAAPRLSDWFHMASAYHWNPLFCVSRLSYVMLARILSRYMELERPHCVLPNLSKATLTTLMATRFLTEPPPIIPIFRDSPEWESHRHKRRLRYLCPHASHLVGVSQGVSDELATILKVPRERITTVYNPVVTPSLQVRMAEPPTHSWLLDRGDPVVLAAGRLTEQKDYPTLIKAFARLAPRRPCRLIILGEGKKRKELEEMVERLGLSNRVSLPGWVENPFAFMAHADVFVLSSIHEGLPGVLVQALACGCPCVSTDCPSGPAEILQNGKFGPLVPVGDEAALAEAMERVLDHPPDRQVLQQRAADFSVEKAVDSYEKLIEACVSS